MNTSGDAMSDTIQSPTPVAVPTSDNISNSDEQNELIACSDGFFMDEQGVCIPECGEWEDLPHSFEVATDTILILHSVVYIASTAVVLALSCIQYKRM